MSESLDSNTACDRIGKMWLNLAELIEAAIPSVLTEVGPEEAIQYGRCSEACFWQATGEATSNDLKDIPRPAGASNADQ